MSLKIFEMGLVQHPLASADPHVRMCCQICQLHLKTSSIIPLCSSHGTAATEAKERVTSAGPITAANAHFVHHLLGYKINFSA